MNLSTVLGILLLRDEVSFQHVQLKKNSNISFPRQRNGSLVAKLAKFLQVYLRSAREAIIVNFQQDKWTFDIKVTPLKRQGLTFVC